MTFEIEEGIQPVEKAGFFICADCKENLPLEDYPFDKRKNTRSSSRCQKCHALYWGGVIKKRKLDDSYKQKISESRKRWRVENRNREIIECPDLIKCCGCKQLLPKDNFCSDRGRANGKRADCKECCRKRTKKHRISSKEKIFKPVTERCEICGFKFKPFQAEEKLGHRGDVPVWDHNHNSGQGRGWVCLGCNAGLGLFGDNPAILQKAVEYLKERGHAITRPLIK